MKPEHLPLLNSVSAPTVHPDGTRAVVSVVHPDFDADTYVGQLWSISRNPERLPRRLTRGFRDTSPAFSPDGRVLAFLRTSSEGKFQLHVVDAAGGEPQVITNAKLGVSYFAWAPDSHRIVFAARTPEEGRYGTVDGVSSAAEDARLITDYKYRMNGVGYTADKPLQLFLVHVPDLDDEPKVVRSGRAAQKRNVATDSADQHASKDSPDVPEDETVPPARQLTSAPVDHESATFSSDGATIFFVAALHEGSDGDLATGIYSLAVAGVQEPVPVLSVDAPPPGREVPERCRDRVLAPPGPRRPGALRGAGVSPSARS